MGVPGALVLITLVVLWSWVPVVLGRLGVP